MENDKSESAREIINGLEYHWLKPWEEIEKRKVILTGANEPIIKLLAESPLPTEYGDWTYLVFGDYTSGEIHEVIVYGDMEKGSLGNGEDVILRVHSACKSSELFHAINCECREELEKAMDLIKKKGRGIVIYLMQEGGGAGLKAKVDVYHELFEWKNNKIKLAIDPETGESFSIFKLYQKLGYKQDSRSLAVAVAILKSLGIKSVKLLTNNPKKVQDLVDGGIKTEPLGLHIKPANEMVARILKAKAEDRGHSINKKHIRVENKNGRKKK